MIIVNDEDRLNIDTDIIYVNANDYYIKGSEIYFKLTTILKELGIRRFTYDSSTGKSYDFITHDGIDYASVDVVKQLSGNPNQKITIRQPELYINMQMWDGSD